MNRTFQITLSLALVTVAAGCTYVPVAHHGGGHRAGGDTVMVCHKGKKTLEIPREAASAHINHGDRHGRC